MAHKKTPEERQVLKDYYESLHTVLDETLGKVVRAKVKESTTSSESKISYELEAWAPFQADQLGYRRALKEVLELLP